MYQEIEKRLAQYQDPHLGADFSAAKAIKRAVVQNNILHVELLLGYPFATIQNEMMANIKEWLNPVANGMPIEIKLTSEIAAHVGNKTLKSIPHIKNIIAVASGKGGVGKSTVAINLALALMKEGAQVGIMDADIYGPSQPIMLGAEGERPILQDKKLKPIIRHGIQSMSIGYLIDQRSAMVWRGPMIGKAVEQLLNDTAWTPLDYLIVDLPPGTGDIQLTLCQKVPLSGAVIVTTPQDLALSDVRRACEMFNKLSVPILGVVENMSVYHCQKCGHSSPIFGEGGGNKLAQEFKLRLLQAIPLDITIREMTDRGQPPVVNDEESSYANLFLKMARQVAAILALQNKDYSAKFPKIVVENTAAQNMKQKEG